MVLGMWFALVGTSLIWTLLDVIRHPSADMPIMNWVWPLVALYFGPFGALLYVWLSARGRGANRLHVHPALAMPPRPGGLNRGAPHPHTPQVVQTVPGTEHAADLAPSLPGGTRGAHPVVRPPVRSHPAPVPSAIAAMHGSHGMAGKRDPLWMRSARSATHCMAGCALGDLMAMAMVEGTGWFPFGTPRLSEVVLGAVLAVIFGLLVFQALPVMVERGVRFREALGVAFQADVTTITAYLAGQIPALYLFDSWTVSGMGGAMPSASATTTLTVFATMLLAMQGSMAAGFLTTYPVNLWLVARGIKHGM